MDRIEEIRKRHALRVGEKRADDDGQWITTKNGHHVHLNEEGHPDKGNPHVIAKMTGGGGQTGTGQKLTKRTNKEKQNAKDRETIKKWQEFKKYRDERYGEGKWGGSKDFEAQTKGAEYVRAVNRLNPEKEMPTSETHWPIEFYYSDDGDTVEFENDKGKKVKYACIGKENGKGPKMYVRVENDQVQTGGEKDKLTLQKMRTELRHAAKKNPNGKTRFYKAEYEKQPKPKKTR